MYLCSVIRKQESIIKKERKMDEVLENQIRYLETLLKEYTRISDVSGVSTRSQEETMNRILDRLSELYKKRKK